MCKAVCDNDSGIILSSNFGSIASQRLINFEVLEISVNNEEGEWMGNFRNQAYIAPEDYIQPGWRQGSPIPLGITFSIVALGRAIASNKLA